MWPDVHEALSGHFASTGYDVKDLFRLIMNSQAYQRAAADGRRRQRDQTATVRCGCAATRYSPALALGIELPNVTPPAVAPTAEIRFPPPPASTCDLVNAAFGTDPSLSPVDAPRTMAQALWMMNNEQLQKQLDAAPGSGTLLSRLLDDEEDDQSALTELYARVLARKPTDDERQIAAAHVEKLGDRRAAFEDLLWSLLNSAEFTTRR